VPAHPPQGVDESCYGGALSVPGLPQVEDGLCGTGLGGEEGHVAIHAEPLRQLSPVVVEGGGRVQEGGHGLLHCKGDPEWTWRRFCSNDGTGGCG